MTLEEQRKAITEYCNGKICSECILDAVCDPIFGKFNEHPTETEIAYKLITGGTCENDPVEHPSHYTQGGIQCIDAMVAAFGKEAVATWSKLNAFKYIWRADLKNGIQDIDKAIWYLNKYKELTAIE